MSVASEPRERRTIVDSIARRLGIDRFELGALVVLAGLSVATLVPLLTRGRPLSGADGLLAVDQLQYLTWIREASQHGLIGDRFDLAPGDRVLLHPGFLISGLLHRVTGISIPLSYLLWKPVAVGVTFTGCLLYVRRLLPRGAQQRTALVLALFAVMPASAIVAWTHWGGGPRQYTFDFISGELWSGQYLWGYLMTSIAVFLMPLVLLAIERWRGQSVRSTRLLALAAAGALLITWMQPWQGGTLLVILVAVEAFRFIRSRERPPVQLLLVLGAGLVPAAYYAILARSDPAWELASHSNAAGAQTAWHWPWWAMVLVLLPLALPAAFAYRLRAPSWQEQAVRIWPFAGLLVYLQPFGTFPYHAFQGLTLPLAILAVQGVASVWKRTPVAGWQPRTRVALVIGIVAVMTIPGFVHKLQVAKNSVHAGGDPFFIFPNEHTALSALERDPRPGGVLGPTYAGYMLPYTTGRETYVGPFSWTPDWEERHKQADDLFEGRLTGGPARAFVRSTHARFLFADCRPGLRGLTAELRPLLERVDHYGCATVYVLKPRPDMARAAGKPDS